MAGHRDMRRAAVPAAIRSIVAVSGASEITLVLDAAEALRLADDLDWAARSRDGAWVARKIFGAVREEGY